MRYVQETSCPLRNGAHAIGALNFIGIKTLEPKTCLIASPISDRPAPELIISFSRPLPPFSVFLSLIFQVSSCTNTPIEFAYCTYSYKYVCSFVKNRPCAKLPCELHLQSVNLPLRCIAIKQYMHDNWHDLITNSYQELVFWTDKFTGSWNSNFRFDNVSCLKVR